mmetsp:Transcript_65228/g.116269  ORF Transcript_65228/g.116269 Transcript_65228/m.116269 type:complete len:158 (-) Transcript_65228:16-489(-)
MSSIQQAVADDFRGSRGGKFNPVALSSKQEAQYGPLIDDHAMRMAQQREFARQSRAAEGGRGGGYNDRQGSAERKNQIGQDDGDFDDFGRRKVMRKAEDPPLITLSKAERARAALERLHKTRGSGQSAGSRGRSSSQSPPRSSRNRSRSRGNDVRKR